jgi:hypothetical protein
MCCYGCPQLELWQHTDWSARKWGLLLPPSSETSLNFCQTARRNSPQDTRLHTLCHENLRSPRRTSLLQRSKDIFEPCYYISLLIPRSSYPDTFLTILIRNVQSHFRTFYYKDMQELWKYYVVPELIDCSETGLLVWEKGPDNWFLNREWRQGGLYKFYYRTSTKWEMKSERRGSARPLSTRHGASSVCYGGHRLQTWRIVEKT